MMFADATAGVPNILAWKVKALGTSAAKPTTLLPSIVPVAATVPGFDWQAWQGIAAPAGMPPEILIKLSAALQRIEMTPEFREQLYRFGMEPGPSCSHAIRRVHRGRAAAMGQGREGFRR